jgi:perosamine synthetase
MNEQFLIKQVVDAVRQVVGHNRSVALHEPEFRGNEWEYVKSCIDEGWVSSVGSFVSRFESELAHRLGRKHAIACVNGTAALHIALKVAGVRPGDEVIVPSLTFVATVNAIYHCSGIPHFVDSDYESLGLCPKVLQERLETISAKDRTGNLINAQTGRRIAAIVPVHIFGHPVRIEEISQIAAQYGIPLIEDATEALGTTIGGSPVGRHGTASVLSFNGNKVVTTGGGGAVLTDDDAFSVQVRHLTTTAKRPHRWEFQHDQVAYNYRMPNINAALGCAQLERLDDFVERKRILTERYQRAFSNVQGIRLHTERDGTRSNYWLQALILESDLESYRDPLLTALNDAGLQSRPAWHPMHLLPFNADCPRTDLSVTEAISRRLINIPSSPSLVNV